MIKDEENVPSSSHPASAPSAPAYAYGTFQGVANYPPPGHPEPTSIGFPQPHPHLYYPYVYQTVPGYAVVEGRAVREGRLPCCGIGCGWFLFIIGFFLIAIPWYVGLLILMCGRSVDYREKPGLIACTIAAILGTIAIIIEATERTHRW